MTALERAYIAWRQHPLPPCSSDDELHEVHTDLALVDTWVAEVVVPFVEQRRYAFTTVDIDGALRGIRERADAAAASGADGDAELAARYRAYADCLKALYEEFERTVAQAGLSN
jgi:hypothetical protein